MPERVSHQMKVLIVGGGIGGLTAAIALVRQGIDVDVYERADSFKEIGAGVSLAPNARRLLERLGLREELKAICPEIATGIHKVLRDYQTGEVQQIKRYTTQSEASSRVLRSELLDMLKDAIPADHLHASKQCTSLVQEKSGKVTVQFADGTSATGDVVIGADGIHSVVRKSFVDDKPTFSGQVAYRALVKMEDLDPTIVNMQDIKESTIWRAPDRHFLAFPISRAGRLLNIVAFFPPATEDDFVESWHKEGRKEDFMAQIEGWDPQVRHVVSKAGVLRKWALYDREALPKWTQGRVTLMGDAAHAVLPHQGQGAGQSIEDGYVVALCLGDSTIASIDDRLALYERVRKPRAEEAQRTSRALGKIYSSDDTSQKAQDSFDNRWSWLWDYDIDKTFEQCRREIVAS